MSSATIEIEDRQQSPQLSDRINDSSARTSPDRWWIVCAGLAAAMIIAAYANHFHNGFHFDDAHAVLGNVYIRSLHNALLFFTDGRTFSSLPTNQTWRPLVTLSLAFDYWLAGGLKPEWFHITTFVWFCAQIVLMYLLYRRIMDSAAGAVSRNAYLALLAAAWYALHPANAETVNYIIQRADIYSTLGVIGGLVLYIRFPEWRKFGLYLLPVALGTLSKSPAVAFAPILLVYVFLFEEDAEWKRVWIALRRCTPALSVCAALAVLTIKMTPSSYVPAEIPAWRYWATQPYVILRYFRSLLLPLWLSADTDLQPVSGMSDSRCVAGLLFCVGLVAAALWTARRRITRPIAFGIAWFFMALAPTSAFVLSEVENDHRMFFPFVGMVLSVVWAAYLLVSLLPQWKASKLVPAGCGVLCCCLLTVYAMGTRQRNEVWRSEDTLWRDVTIKSPRNGRGLMNYGLTLMAKGAAPEALDYFERAAVFTPNYYVLEINLAIANGLLNRPQEGEAHFRRAIALAPQDAQPYFYYSRWLQSQARISESEVNAKAAIEKNPAYMEARYLLMQVYQQKGQWTELQHLAEATLKLWPEDAVARQYLERAQAGMRGVEELKQQAEKQPTPERLLNLSLSYFQYGRYEECIAAARAALDLQPNYAEAYNNIAAAYQSLRQWDQAIAAAQQAVRLKPNFQLARNNLAYSQAQKRLAQAGH